jgi:hypothetical protein
MTDSFFSFRHPGHDPGSSHGNGNPAVGPLPQPPGVLPSGCLLRLSRSPDWISNRRVIKPGMTESFFSFRHPGHDPGSSHGNGNPAIGPYLSHPVYCLPVVCSAFRGHRLDFTAKALSNPE